MSDGEREASPPKTELEAKTEPKSDQQYKIVIQLKGLTGNISPEHVKELMSKFGDVTEVGGAVTGQLFDFPTGKCNIEFDDQESLIRVCVL